MKRPERWREGPRTAAWFLHTLAQRLPKGLRPPQDSHCHHREYLSDPARLKSLHRPLARLVFAAAEQLASSEESVSAALLLTLTCLWYSEGQDALG